MMLRLLALLGGAALLFVVGARMQPHPPVRLPLFGAVPGATISQPFGCTALELEPFDVWCPTHHFHTGVDLAAPQGTGVYSTTSGAATLGYDPFGAGNYVVIRVDRHVRILYCHLASFTVQPGTQVKAGQLIGAVGATGLATGPHVHLEVQVDGTPVDPAIWLGS